MKSFLYTVVTVSSFEAAVDALEEKVVQKGFHVLHTYDEAVALAGEKGCRCPIKIIEVCDMHCAHRACQGRGSVAGMRSCPILVHTDGEKTFISIMRASALASFYPPCGLKGVVGDVENLVLQLVAEARGLS